MRFDFTHEWKDLEALSRKTSREAIAILQGWELDLGQDACGDGVGLGDVDLDGDFFIYLDGYWADECPMVVIKKGMVARWHRTGSWE